MKLTNITVGLAAAWLSSVVAAEPPAPQPASAETREANLAFGRDLPFDDVDDFANARRGLIARPDSVDIRKTDGQPVWNLDQYRFVEQQTDTPDTVNPSLWRQTRLNNLYGLYEVIPGIYQVRGYDLSNITFVATDNGYLVIDPLISAETARAALDLLYQHRPQKPVVAVIYSHSHADHFAGVRGVIDEADVTAGKVRIIAPEGFMAHAVSENVYAGNAMGRRASYMYGSLLPRGPTGQVDAGLGKTTSSGTLTLIEPTDIISETGTEMVIDGLRIVFQNTPGTEAPAEMNFYFPDLNALCMAENISSNMHNLYTLRGAQVRDARAWSHYIDESIALFGERTEVLFTSHHWPRWGREAALEYLSSQRDLYKYLHDQTLRLANHGYTMNEIAEMVELPPNLARVWSSRGYYGSVSHNVKAVYQRYLGWFDGNPANLHPLPPTEASRRYVEFMGGSEAVLEKARLDYDQGDYRWVAEVVNHVVFAEPENAAARELQAAALEQLGYQAESAPWRNFYLTGAAELRHGVRRGPAPNTRSPDLLRALDTGEIFDFLAIRLNGPRAQDVTLAINWEFVDSDERYALVLRNSVLNHFAGQTVPEADLDLSLSRETLLKVMTKQTSFEQELASGNVTAQGNPQVLAQLFALLDEFEFWFDIVTP